MPISITILITSMMVMDDCYQHLQHPEELCLCPVPGSKTAGPQAHKDRTDEFPKGGCVDRIQFLFLTVPQVMVIQGAPGQAHSFRRLVVVQQPLQLKIHRRRKLSRALSEAQWTNTLLCVRHLVRTESSSAYYHHIKGWIREAAHFT